MNRFFRSTTKGEAGEIRDDINSEEKHRQKQALTKIIAGMTLGRDMSNVFPDVVRLMGTNAVDIKKLVYLYLMQYATGMPEKAILVAGSIARDTMHPSPLIRGLAIRTMSSITTERMMECAVEPLRRCLKEDHDPYVHRCAVMAILKMYNTSRNVCEGNGFLPLLMEQFSSGNATVVATVASVVRELHQLRGSEEGLEVTPRIATTLQNALPEANEWGQISILELLSNYVPLDREEAELICDRVLPWLQHGNSSIVLTTVKIIVNYLDNWCDSNAPGASEAQKEEKMRRYGSKLAPALVSLVTSHAMEIRYVVLRNVNLIARKFPDLLVPSLRIFYVKYNDPIYVKLEKLEILSMLANKNNVEQLLSECVEYAQEVDIEFVRKAVRTIGFLALKIDVAAAECVQQLVHLVKTKVNYIVQEAIVVIRDIFRRYPNQYESIISVLCENLETLDEPEAKSAMIWIVGEYADRIENAMELLEIFTDTFEEEIIPVRMTILGAVVKLYLKRGEEAEGLLQTILKECTESDIPDLRDRAFLYWRLLTTDAEVAAQTILSQREIVSTDTSTKYDRQLLSHLLKYIGTLSSVYHKPPQNLFTVSVHSAVSVRTLLGALLQYDEEEEEEENAGSKPNETGGQESGGGKSSLDFLDVFSDVPSTSGQASSQPTTSTATTQEMPFAAKSVPKAAAGATFDDLFAGPQSSHPPLPPPQQQQQQQQQHPSAPGVPCTAPGRVASTLDDFLSDLTQPSHGAPTTLPEVPMSQDPFSFPPPVPKTPALPCVLTAGQSGGLGIYGRLRPVQPTDGFDASCSVALELEFCNETSPGVPIQNIALQMNRNPFGFTLRETLKIEETITPAGRKTICVALRHVPANVTPAVQSLNVKALPFAVKSSLTQVSVAYFSLPVHVGSLLFATANTMSQDAFSQGWMNTPNTNVRNVRVAYNAALYPPQLMIEKLFDELSLKFVVERTGLHFFAGLVGGCRAGAPGGNYCLVGVRTDATSGQLDVVVKCNDLIVLNIVEYAIQGLFVM